MLKLILLIFFVVIIITEINGYKILIYNPRFGGSHTRFTGKIADILANAGHEIHVYQPMLDKHMKTSGSKNETIKFYELHGAEVTGEMAEENKPMLWEDDTLGKIVDMLQIVHEVRVNTCSSIMNDHQNHELLKQQNFDLGIVEIFEACGLGVLERLGINKYILTHSSSMNPSMTGFSGVPKVPSFVPIVFSGFTDQMTFIQRLWNFIGVFFEKYSLGILMTTGPEEVIKRDFPEFDLEKKALEASYLFVNSDEHVDYTVPITPKTIYIGGFDVSNKNKKLEEKFSKIFNSAKKGVILVSFGSNLRSADMPKKMKNSFLNTFKKFPEINFIWKYENETHKINDGISNLYTSDWLPQNEILENEKLLGFITHGGMNSVTESATKGVPTICIPLFGDQHHNCMMLTRRNIAQIILKHQVNEDNLFNSITNLVEDKKYKENAKIISEMVKNKPMNANERITKYVEFAAKFKDTTTLISESINLNWMQLYSIDVISFLFLIVFIIFYIVYRIFKFIFRFIFIKNVKNNNNLNVKKNN